MKRKILRTYRVYKLDKVSKVTQVNTAHFIILDFEIFDLFLFANK